MQIQPLVKDKKLLYYASLFVNEKFNIRDEVLLPSLYLAKASSPVTTLVIKHSVPNETKDKDCGAIRALFRTLIIKKWPWSRSASALSSMLHYVQEVCLLY